MKHLLFADDSQFFSLANPKAGRRLKQIFNLYEFVSRQAINSQKSSITFGSKVTANFKKTDSKVYWEYIMKDKMKTILEDLNSLVE